MIVALLAEGSLKSNPPPPLPFNHARSARSGGDRLHFSHLAPPRSATRRAARSSHAGSRRARRLRASAATPGVTDSLASSRGRQRRTGQVAHARRTQSVTVVHGARVSAAVWSEHFAVCSTRPRVPRTCPKAVPELRLSNSQFDSRDTQKRPSPTCCGRTRRGGEAVATLGSRHRYSSAGGQGRNTTPTGGSL